MNTRGTVFAEFLIAFVPFFLLFLGGVQLALMAAASLVVKHAAYRAARQAVMTIDDDPVFHDCAPRGVLDTGAPERASDEQRGKRGALRELIGNVAGSLGSALDEEGKGGPRVQVIRDAAYLPLAVLAPEPSYLARTFPGLGALLGGGRGDDSLHGAAVGTSPYLRVATGYFVYSKLAAAITFPAHPGGEARAGTLAYGPDDMVTTRVRFLYPCAVPVVRALMCDSLLEMTGLAHLDEDVRHALRSGRGGPAGVLRDLRERKVEQLEQFNELYRELQHAEWAAGQNAYFLTSAAQFAVLTGEATLPNQGAPYKYWSELSGRCEER